MKYSPIDSQLFIRNRQKLLARLESNSVAIVNSNDEFPRNGDQNFNFRQNSDLFYLTGIEQEKTVLVFCPNHVKPEMREILFILRASVEHEIWYGHKLTKDEAKAISGIQTIKFHDELDTTLTNLMINSESVYINMNENLRFETDVTYRDLRFINQLKNRFPLHNYKRLAPIISSLRLIKEPEEIEIIRKACQITNQTFQRLLKFVKPDIKEYEIEAEIIHEFIRNGAADHSFHPIVASGKNACYLHYPYNDQVCKDGDLILIDFGAEYANYAADTTRTIPVNGKFTERQKQIYSSVLKVMKEAKKLMVKGQTINKLNEAVGLLVEKELLALGLLKDEDIKNQDKDWPAYKKYYMHGNSHFMGLDVHDVGTRDLPFEAGMVLSCEPGIYIMEEGIGIRLENDILITDGEPIDLLIDEPIEIEGIERLMAE